MEWKVSQTVAQSLEELQRQFDAWRSSGRAGCRIPETLWNSATELALFVFRNRRVKAIKILAQRGQGFWLCQERLSQGRFGFWPKTPHVIKAWSWRTDTPKSDKGDVEIGGRSEKCKTKMTPISIYYG